MNVYPSAGSCLVYDAPFTPFPPVTFITETSRPAVSFSAATSARNVESAPPPSPHGHTIVMGLSNFQPDDAGAGAGAAFSAGDSTTTGAVSAARDAEHKMSARIAVKIVNRNLFT